MKILSGQYKGIFIRTESKSTYRPTAARVRKSLFDILGPLENLTILDLFSGSGMLGFEAMSRGGRALTFVEDNASANKLLLLNAKNIGLKCTIKRSDVLKFLTNCPHYDLILADPPYGKYDLQLLVELCLKKLNYGGRLVVESSKHDAVLNGIKIKKYGDTRITFFTNE
ncbi:MAG: methyltransferase [Candidatus Marinimicrobia bacterium]|nr:methyltransferase [Candidatus Neomarinimicrobiota bacterium]MBT3618129.1 methyltransferase [Candidatus Neomarinimicrobiota bacterium]MBT3828600.1 methyltransferase [Candidatus Neomarinimicrobiota bacterium]MBT3996938.1 methyltransferase [Candidatus Neomarinimicrobiota bacterium]MBT4280902.1 methyltransferase [Candidatus Neomarinimicrobiota bacterium]